MMGTPIHVDGQRRGVLHAGSERVDAFSDQDLRFLEAVAQWVGMVAHRADLTAQLARDAAEEARRTAAEELMTILAHDLRNHLTPLNSRIDLIWRTASREGDQRYQDHARAARAAVSRLKRLTRDLTDAARLEQEFFALSTRPVDLAKLVEETVSEFQTPTAPVHCRCPEELVAEVDPDRLRQLLENLVSNALKNSPKGVPVIVEMDEEATEDGRRVVVTVRDEGPGIPAGLLPRLFTRFGSGPDSQGLGLGLYLAKGIADAHGGTLTAESSRGHGAAFRLCLPLS